MKPSIAYRPQGGVSKQSLENPIDFHALIKLYNILRIRFKAYL
jgi:hypothetical protein